jgi:hypothetical protein
MSARSQFLAAAMEITNRQTCECRNLSPIEMVEVMERCVRTFEPECVQLLEQIGILRKNGGRLPA